MTATLIQTPKTGILLNHISWKTYESLVNELAEQPGIRLNYDRGNLEIMTPSAPHEGSKKILGRNRHNTRLPTRPKLHTIPFG